MSVKMYLSWRTKQRKFSPLGAKHHFLLLFCPPVRLHLHKREMGLLELSPISKGRFTRYDFVAYGKLTTGLQHESFHVNQNYNSLTMS